MATATADKTLNAGRLMSVNERSVNNFDTAGSNVIKGVQPFFTRVELKSDVLNAKIPAIG